MTVDRAVKVYKALRHARGDTFDVRNAHYHYDAYKPFAETIIGDMARKIHLHLMPKLNAAADAGLTVRDTSILPLRSSNGELCGCDIVVDGQHVFTIHTLHTPGGGSRRASDTVSVFRAGEKRSITYATIHAPDKTRSDWVYKSYDGPGAVRGIVEACSLIIPFIENEVRSDRTSDTLSAACLLECDALIDADGGLPGAHVLEFANAVLEDGTELIARWLAKAMPEASSKLGDHATWPHSSLVYNDNDEHFSIIRSANSVGVVHYMPLLDERPRASITALVNDHKGEALRLENHVVFLGDGSLAKAIEEHAAGLRISGHPNIKFEYATGRVETTADYLELKHYVRFALPVDHCTIDWRGNRIEAITVGVDAFLEADGEPAREPASRGPTFKV